MVVYWYVKIECKCGKGMQRKLVAGETLTSKELGALQERYNNHCQWCPDRTATIMRTSSMN